MPYKDPEQRKIKQREYSKRWYENNKSTHIERTNRYKRLKREDWMAYKATLKCTHCGAQHPAIIDFHHLIHDATYQAVNELSQKGQFTAAKLESEKCIPLCANCHRILHYEQIQTSKRKRKKKNPAHGGVPIK